MLEKRKEKTGTKKKNRKQIRRRLALLVMVGILVAGVENCFLLSARNDYAAGTGRGWSVSAGKVGNETELESESEGGSSL
ncbi:MAG: hypothetical protein LIP11_17125 [Clostridiales bacterium]|nr:hypothetical protein [Clostridiales bacterium]